MSQSKNWCFTSFVVPRTEKGTYMIYGIEICPNTKKVHYQGYVEYSSNYRIKAVKDDFHDNTLHVESRKGSQIQAIDYCKKDGKFEEFGKKKEQGRRIDLEKFKNRVKRKATDMELLDEGFIGEIAKYPRLLPFIRNAYSEKRSWKTTVFNYWGPSGSGKSRRAFNFLPDAYVKDDTQWFDGYLDGQDIICEDLKGNMPISVLLQLLDRYKVQGQIKGSYVNLNPKILVITSKLPITRYYDEKYSDEISRRVDIFEEIYNDVGEQDLS